MNASTTPPPATAEAPLKVRWYRRGWFIGVVALLVGIVIGAASAAAADPTDSPEYQTVSTDLEEARGQLQSSQEEAAAAEERVAATEAELEQVAGDLPSREAALEKAESALAKREDALAGAETDVKAAEKAVGEREKAVGAIEQEVADNTIPGEGVFEVGVDMKPGAYKTSGADGCYYAVNGDANGNNIKSNNITNGPATVTVAGGEYFETSDCSDWILQP